MAIAENIVQTRSNAFFVNRRKVELSGQMDFKPSGLAKRAIIFLLLRIP
jgi:hypothetical protein